MCAAVAGRRKPAYVLAGLVLVLGAAMAIPVLTQSKPDPGPRTADVGNMDAMMKAREPVWAGVVNPLVGFLGTILGARLKKEAPRPA